MAATNDTFEPLKLSEFCDRIQVDEREVRYALARGIVPKGMRKTPGRGHHRQFNAHQSFWMAIVLRLKAAVLRVTTFWTFCASSRHLGSATMESGAS